MTTASEQLIHATRDLILNLMELSPLELAVNSALSLGVVGVAVLAAHLVRAALRRAASVLPGPSDAEKHVRTRRVARFTVTVFDGALVLAAVYVVCRIWGFDVGAWMSRGLGERLVRSLLRIAFLIVISFAAMEIAGLLINQLVGRLLENATRRRQKAQLNTLAPLMRGVAQTAIIIIGALMVMSEIGVQIGPLLAGAGVVGIAVGFGAQTLVKDFITGVFLLAEDIVAVGDVVNIGGFGGLVEQMTLRTIRLRDFDGTLHVFPYSEAQVVHNLTKSFSYYVFNLQISYDSDIDKAIEVMRDTGAKLMADPAYSEFIMEPIEVVGVDSLADSGVVIKARIKTRPIQQWNVGREYNKRIKQAFDANGIEIPYPHLKLVAAPAPQPPPTTL
ncbi:mechanosensitive ion channel family protein [Phenylobacterium sp.]|uniref:mechanosensitive ion channel family protein n=1 Tax=Phenylobacterium sp. TaxID=1871053 RepID=UPI0035B41B65